MCGTPRSESVAALAFDDWGPVGWQERYYVGSTGTGRSNAYFVASLNGGRRGPEFHLGWHGPPPGPQ